MLHFLVSWRFRNLFAGVLALLLVWGFARADAPSQPPQVTADQKLARLLLGAATDDLVAVLGNDSQELCQWQIAVGLAYSGDFVGAIDRTSKMKNPGLNRSMARTEVLKIRALNGNSQQIAEILDLMGSDKFDQPGQAYSLAASVAALRGDVDTARGFLSKATPSRSDHAQAIFLIPAQAAAQAEIGDLKGAAALVEQLPEKKRDIGYISIAVGQARGGNMDGARSTIAQLTDDARPLAIVQISIILAHKKDFAGAKALVQTIPDTNTARVERDPLFEAIAVLQATAGDRPGAIETAHAAGDIHRLAAELRIAIVLADEDKMADAKQVFASSMATIKNLHLESDNYLDPLVAATYARTDNIASSVKWVKHITDNPAQRIGIYAHAAHVLCNMDSQQIMAWEGISAEQ